MGNKWIDSRNALIENNLVQISDFVTVKCADTGVQKYIATLPKGAVILEYLIETVATFNSAGSDYFTLGFLGDDDAYYNDLDISAGTAIYRGTVNVRLTADTAVYATYTDGNASATTGEMRCAVMWAPWTALVA